jgi:IS5 family transposase
MKSFKPKEPAGDEPPAGGGRKAERDFHGDKRTNATHASTTDPDARLIRRGRGQEAKLCHMGHLLMENQSGLLVDAMLTTATGTAERAAAEAMLAGQTGRHRAALGADKGYDAADFVAAVRGLNVTPHIAQNTSRRSAIDGRTPRHPGYALSQRTRKRIEEAFGWIKTTGGFRKTRHRGTARGGWLFTLTAAACNLVRLPKLLEAA